MDLEAQAFGRGEGYALLDAIEARLFREDAAARHFDARGGFGDQFGRQCLKPYRMGGILLGVDEHQFRGPTIGTQPCLRVVPMGDLQAENLGCVADYGLGVSDIDLHVPHGMHDVRHDFPPSNSFWTCVLDVLIRQISDVRKIFRNFSGYRK
ncbi:hypothetical protein D9M68_738980 [compost metagenome]